MSDEERDWIKNKRGLLIKVLKASLEERVYDYINSDQWKSVEELDAWVDGQLRQFEDTKDAIVDFYDEKMYS